MIYIGGEIIYNKGIRNELDFISKLNNKRVSELDFLLQDMIYSLFPNTTGESVVNCKKGNNYEKTDISISINNSVKNISLKLGYRNSIHSEKVSSFSNFLYSIGIKKEIIYEILKYQYADGTIDGTGLKRIGAEEYKINNKKSIDRINKFINNECVINKCINRFLLQGTNENYSVVDVLICGTPDDFFYVTRDELYKYILDKINFKSSSIHFSCLIFQSLSRVLDYNSKTEYRRNWVQIKWYSIGDIMFEILNERYVKNLKRC